MPQRGMYPPVSRATWTARAMSEERFIHSVERGLTQPNTDYGTSPS